MLRLAEAGLLAPAKHGAKTLTIYADRPGTRRAGGVADAKIGHQESHNGINHHEIYHNAFVVVGRQCVMGVIRKLRGGTFMPPPGSDGDHNVQDKSWQWWRHEVESNTFEQMFRSKKKR